MAISGRAYGTKATLQSLCMASISRLFCTSARYKFVGFLFWLFCFLFFGFFPLSSARVGFSKRMALEKDS